MFWDLTQVLRVTFDFFCLFVFVFLFVSLFLARAFNMAEGFSVLCLPANLSFSSGLLPFGLDGGCNWNLSDGQKKSSLI